MIHFRVRYESLAGKILRLRRRTALVRALWLGMLATLAWTAWYAASGVRPAAAWLLIGPVIAVGAGVWGARASGIDLGRWLDRQFRLDELVVTAVEVDRRGARSEVEARLLDDAAETLARLRTERGLTPTTTRREAQTVLAIAALATGMWLLGLSQGDNVPVVQLEDLVVDTSGGDGTGPGRGSGSGSGSARGSGATGEMQALADQLDDHASARAVAAALAAGDPWSAARAARALADQSADMSDQGRKELADALHAAADAGEAANPELAEALRRAGRALESPDRNVAAAGVEELATEFGSLAGRGAAAGAGQLEPRAESRPGPQAQRLAVTPAPASLDQSANAGAVQAGGSRSVAQDASSGAETYVTGGAPRSTSGAAGPDILGYPWAMREALRRYFDRHGVAP